MKQKFQLIAALVLCVGLTALLLAAAFGSHSTEAEAVLPPDVEIVADAPQFYTGPILPLHVQNSTLTADRSITLDLTTPMMAAVTDQYVLINELETDQTVTLFYPIVGSLTSPADILPTLTVDGAAPQTEFLAGDYAGTFSNTDGLVAKTPEEMFNLRQCNFPEHYHGLLNPGHGIPYMSHLISETPLPQDTAIVYTLQLPEDAAAEVNFTCTIPDGVTVLPLGWRSAAGNGNTQTFTFMKGHSRIAQLLVLGGDISDAAVDTGSCSRTEALLADCLRQIIESDLGYQPEGETVEDRLSPDLSVNCMIRWLQTYSPSGSTPAIRYRLGMGGDLLEDARTAVRIFFLRTEVTIPAGGSITVEATLQKEAGFHYGEPQRESYELTFFPVGDIATGSTLLHLLGTEGLTIDSHETVTIPLSFGRTTDIELDLSVLYLHATRP